MNIENKKLKDLINKSLEENPIPYEDKYWTAAEKLLEKEKRKTGWLFFMVPATIIIALSTGYWYWNNKSQINVVSNTTTEIENKKVTPSVVAETEATIKDVKQKNDNNSTLNSEDGNEIFSSADVKSEVVKSLDKDENTSKNMSIQKHQKEQPFTFEKTEAAVVANKEEIKTEVSTSIESSKTDETTNTSSTKIETFSEETNAQPTDSPLSSDKENLNDSTLNEQVNTNTPLLIDSVEVLPISKDLTKSDELEKDIIAIVDNKNLNIPSKIENDESSTISATENIKTENMETAQPTTIVEIPEQINKIDSTETPTENLKEIEPAAPIEVKIEKQKRLKQFSLGFLAGIGLTPAITSQIGNKYNYLSMKAGLNADYTIGKIGLSTGVNYHIRNGYNYSFVTFKKGYSFGTSNIRTEYLPTQSRYLEIPLMLHYKTGRHLIGIGGAFEYMLQTKLKVENHGTQTTKTEVGNYDFMHQYDLGIMLQYQYTVNANFSIGVNIFQGTSDVVSNEKSNVVKKDINRFLEPVLIYKLIKR